MPINARLMPALLSVLDKASLEATKRGDLEEAGRCDGLIARLTRDQDKARIDFESGVNAKGEPFVHLSWGPMHAQLTPEEVTRHALATLEVSAGAITDAFLVRFLAQATGAPVDKATALIMQNFRDFREARASRFGAPDKEKD